MPHPRFEKLSSDKRSKILYLAAQEFSSHGYDGASLNHIIGRTGLTKGHFYYYFDSKADLFATVVNMVWDLFLPDSGMDLASLTPESFWPSMESISRAIRIRLRENPWLAGISKSIYNPPRNEAVQKLLAMKFSQMREWLGAILRRGRELGVIREDLPVELLLAMLVGADEAADRWFLQHWDRLTPSEMDSLWDRMFALYRRLLEPAREEAG